MKLLLTENFLSKLFIAQHMKVHSNGDWKCNICEIWFTQQSLMMHQKLFHPVPRRENIYNLLKETTSKKVTELLSNILFMA